MKLLVETSGPFKIQDMQTGDVATHNRPSVVTSTPFIQQRVACGQLKVLVASVADSFTDAEWAELYAADGLDAVALVPAQAQAPAPFKGLVIKAVGTVKDPLKPKPGKAKA